MAHWPSPQVSVGLGCPPKSSWSLRRRSQEEDGGKYSGKDGAEDADVKRLAGWRAGGREAQPKCRMAGWPAGQPVRNAIPRCSCMSYGLVNQSGNPCRKKKTLQEKNEGENFFWRRLTDWSTSPERGLRTGHQSGTSESLPS